MFGVTDTTKERARLLASNPPAWQRPKAEDVAKQLDMRFLYRFGYDFASTHVHPMANDGDQDFYTIAKLKPAHEFPDQRSVLSNTLLVATMIMQEGLNASSLRWRALVYDCVADLRLFLDKGALERMLSFVRLGRMIESGMTLSSPAVESENS